MSNHQPVPVSVIICAYSDDRRDGLIVAVRSVQAQRRPAAEIIVVIDHNPKLFNDIRTTLPEVRTVENRQARGLSGARNTGVSLATQEIVAFLDDDAIATADWLQHLVAPYDNAQVLGVGGAIEPLWQVPPPAWFPPEFHWVVGCSYLGMPKVRSHVRNFLGCNMSFRRQVFTIGGFRDGIGRVGTNPLGCEETEFCIRLRQACEGALLYEPAALVCHLVPPNRASWRYFRSRCYSEGLSKAMVSKLVGSKHALANERSYAFSLLARGFWSAVGDQLLGGQRGGFLRAVNLIVGLGCTTAGYAGAQLAMAAGGVHISGAVPKGC
jgi:glucosyl-dolichyl phosphate glucuronosyltransferase